MNVVVLCPKPSLRWKYWKNQPVHREYGYWFLDENIPNQDKFRFRHNAKKKTRQVCMAIFQGLIKVLEDIVERDYDNTLFVQDDAIIDWDTLNQIDFKSLPETLIYFGGGIAYPMLKDLHKKDPSIRTVIKFKKGLNKIDETYRVLGCWGLFIKNKEVANKILDNIERNGKYLSTIDDMALSKMNIDKYLYYPPISTVRTNLTSMNAHNNKNLDSYNHY